jgi:phage gp16-like protein
VKRPADLRKKQLARIHASKKAMGLDDETYRDLLERVTGKRSSAVLDDAQRDAVLKELARLQKQYRRPGQPDQALIDAKPMLQKVNALLADSKRPWSYAHAIAEQMHSIKRVEWLDDTQLHALVAAMQIDANRRRRQPASTTTRKPPSC